MKDNNLGFTFIELIISAAVIASLGVSLFILLSQVLKFVQIKKIQTEAANLATEEMEKIRNIPYDDVGTVGGIPSGVLEQEKTVLRDGTEYLVRTNVRYIDDPYDGIAGGNPDDLLNTDYKQVKITISWDTIWGAGSMFFLTNVAPKGVETNVDGGTLKINVFNANGEPVPQAKVDIINTNTGVNLIDILTNNNGLIVLPGTPQDVEGYKIIVDKQGFSQARTYYENDPENCYGPNPIYLSVYDGQTTEASFSIDVVSTLQIKTEIDNSPDPPVPLSNIGFSIHGSKVVCLGEGGANIVYKYPYVLNYTPPNFVTDAQGVWADTQIEWDSYFIMFDEQQIGKNIIKYNPPTNPILVNPGDYQTITFTFSDSYTPRSILVTIKDDESNPLSGVSLNLTKDLFSADADTGETGQAFFGGLDEDIYHLTAQKDGYETVELDIEVKTNEEEKIQMFRL